jgi:hypothetical protein
MTCNGSPNLFKGLSCFMVVFGADFINIIGIFNNFNQLLYSTIHIQLSSLSLKFSYNLNMFMWFINPKSWNLLCINFHVFAKGFRAFEGYYIWIVHRKIRSIFYILIQEQDHFHICSRLVFDHQVYGDLLCNIKWCALWFMWESS